MGENDHEERCDETTVAAVSTGDWARRIKEKARKARMAEKEGAREKREEGLRIAGQIRTHASEIKERLKSELLRKIDERAEAGFILVRAELEEGSRLDEDVEIKAYEEIMKELRRPPFSFNVCRTIRKNQTGYTWGDSKYFYTEYEWTISW